MSEQVAAFNTSLRHIAPEELELAVETALHYHTLIAPDRGGESDLAVERTVREQAIAKLEALEVPASLALAAVALGRGRQWPTQVLGGIAGASQLIAHVNGGHPALDSGFAALADALARADSLAPWDSGPLLFTSHPLGLTDDTMLERPGARALLCTLVRMPSQQSPAGGPDYEYVRAASVAKLLVWLESADPSWLEAASDSAVRAWGASGDVQRLRDLLRKERGLVHNR